MLDDAPSPVTLFRVARAGHPTLFPPAGGRGRFSDPESEYRVLYTTLERRACFAESLQAFRPDTATRAEIARLRFGAVPRSEVRLRTWAGSRVVLTLRLGRAARICDLRQSEQIEAVASGVAPAMHEAGIADFDVGHVVGKDRAITQRISRWIYEAGYDGVFYPSRLGSEWTCCAVFNRLRPRVIRRDPIAIDDPDLLAVSALFGITIMG